MAYTQIINRIEKAVSDGKSYTINSDDIYQFYTDGFLTMNMIANLKHIRIEKISDIHNMVNSVGDQKTIEKLSKAKDIGARMSELIINLSYLYEFKNSSKEAKPVETKQQEEKKVEEAKPAETKRSTEDEKEKNDNADHAMGNAVIETIFELADNEKSIGRIEFDDVAGKPKRIGGSYIIKNGNLLLVEQYFLRNRLEKKITNMPTEEKQKKIYFNQLLSYIEDCIKVTSKEIEGRMVKFFFGKKEYTENKLNYVQVFINKAEERICKKLTFSSCKKMSSSTSASDNTGNNVEAEIHNNKKVPLGIVDGKPPVKSKVHIVLNKTVTKTLPNGTTVVENPTRVKKISPEEIYIMVRNQNSTQPTTVEPVKVKEPKVVNPVPSVPVSAPQQIESLSTDKQVSNDQQKQKEEKKMKNLRVKAVKCQEYVTGTYIAAFSIYELKGQNVIKDKFNFDMSGAGDIASKEIDLGYVFYIFEKSAPKNGRYSIPKELEQYADKIKFDICAFFQ